MIPLRAGTTLTRFGSVGGCWRGLFSLSCGLLPLLGIGGRSAARGEGSGSARRGVESVAASGLRAGGALGVAMRSRNSSPPLAARATVSGASVTRLHLFFFACA